VRLPSADAFPTVLHYSICTPCPLTLSLPLSAFGGGGAGERDFRRERWCQRHQARVCGEVGGLCGYMSFSDRWKCVGT